MQFLTVKAKIWWNNKGSSFHETLCGIVSWIYAAYCLVLSRKKLLDWYWSCTTSYSLVDCSRQRDGEPHKSRPLRPRRVRRSLQTAAPIQQRHKTRHRRRHQHIPLWLILGRAIFRIRTSTTLRTPAARNVAGTSSPASCCYSTATLIVRYLPTTTINPLHFH